jgi:hypothetical protein
MIHRFEPFQDIYFNQNANHVIHRLINISSRIFQASNDCNQGSKYYYRVSKTPKNGLFSLTSRCGNNITSNGSSRTNVSHGSSIPNANCQRQYHRDYNKQSESITRPVIDQLKRVFAFQWVVLVAIEILLHPALPSNRDGIVRVSV